ncbi:hypothetical protein Trydic_g14828 [Trypoxylus dichotomus]
MHFRNLIIFLLVTCVFAFYEESPFVIEVDTENFESEVIDGKHVWLLQFFSTSNTDCQDYSDVYEKVAKVLDGFVKVGAVDVNRARLLAYKYNIISLPTVIFINKDRTSTKYRGGEEAIDLINATVNLITKYINDSLVEKYVDLPFVKKLSKTDLEKQVKVSGRWIVAHLNPNTSANKAFKDFFVNLATRLQDNIRFGYHGIEKSEEDMELGNAPTLMFYFGRKSNRTQLKYEGDIEPIDDVIKWILVNIKRPEILELRNENILRESCINKKYCIITVVDVVQNCDRECKDDTKKILAVLAEKYKQYSASWALVRKGMMPTLDDIFSITINTKFPTMLVVNVQTLKSKELEQLNDDKGEEFLEDIFHGSGFPEFRLPGFDNLLQEHYKPWRDEL